MFNNIFFAEIRFLYEIIWKNIVDADRPQMTKPGKRDPLTVNCGHIAGYEALVKLKASQLDVCP
jgi:hypothetical protein